MLDYENEMLLSVVQEDGLTIAAKGLGLEHVFLNLLRVYSDPGNLVLVLGCTDQEEEWFKKEMDQDGVKHLPRNITSDISTSERELVYMEGGVLFITTRILVVDLLMERIPAHLITGILMYRAHRLMDSCQESFILRLYRTKNKTGFIKAFSSSPISFTAGFSQVERVMKNLFVRHLHLWPRFHSTVGSSLSVVQPEVVELHLEMTPKMQDVQTAVLDLISFTLKELKRLNPNLQSAAEELTVENSISKSFHKILQRELDPVWHQLSWKTRQLVADLKTLRTVMTYLTQYDCITFYNLVAALRTAESAMKSGGWVLLDSAETLFLSAKGRVFSDIEAGPAKKAKVGGEEDREEVGLDMEENPKWNAISEIVAEVRAELKENGLDETIPSEKILVVTRDERTASQVQDYLTMGAKPLLARMYNKCFGEKYGFIPGPPNEPPKKPLKELKHKGIGKKSSSSKVESSEVKKADEPLLKVADSPVTIVHSIQGGNFEIKKLLYELKPRFIVLYDSDMTFVRQIEVYQSSHPDLHTRVYFMMYRGSVEEQGYLTTLRREKEAFEVLIKQKVGMVVPEDREGKMMENEELSRDSRKASDVIMESNTLRTRKGGGEVGAKVQPKVIVDMREFRSLLPSLLHKRGIDVEPVTLEVGDYILTPEICVERKSISDLIGSLNSGRLYNQAVAMTRFYTRPMLLIEFDQNKPFALQGKYYLSRDIQSSDLVARLQLLTIHFPKLRILWSPSPHATAELVEELKKGRDEPDASKAVTLGVDIIDEYNTDKYNPLIHDFVSKLPGVTGKNKFGILNSVENMTELLELSQARLGELLGSDQRAEELYAALHSELEAVDPQGKEKEKKKAGFRRFKSKR